MFTFNEKRLYEMSDGEFAGRGRDPMETNTYDGRGAFIAAAATDYLIAGNDEHGLDPPTTGKRTPVLPYLRYQFYENEFNSGAKQYFLQACKRIGFRTYDVKPEKQDISVSERVRRINTANPNAVVTYAYNAFGDGLTFNGVSGVEVIYSNSNASAQNSLRLSNLFYNQLLKGTPQRGRGVYANNNIGVLANVRMPSTLAECGFMTNYLEPKYMLDPDFWMECGEAGCAAVCEFFGILYTPAYPDHNRPTLRQGSRGSHVVYLQNKLVTKLYPAGTADGIFGVKTTDAVKQFQRENGLVVDGIVGKNTWAKLYPIGYGRIIT